MRRQRLGAGLAREAILSEMWTQPRAWLSVQNLSGYFEGDGVPMADSTIRRALVKLEEDDLIESMQIAERRGVYTEWGDYAGYARTTKVWNYRLRAVATMSREELDEVIRLKREGKLP